MAWRFFKLLAELTVPHPRGPRFMKTKNKHWIAGPLAMLLTLGMAFLSGCASTPKPEEREMQRLSHAATVAELAAYTGAGYWLLDHPKDRDKITMAVLALEALSATNGFNAIALHQALSSLPIKELKSEKGSLFVGAAVLLYEAELSRMTPIDQGPYVAVISSRVRAGLLRALEQTGPPPGDRIIGR